MTRKSIYKLDNPGADTRALFGLAELFDFLDDTLVWVKDRQGRYVWVNRAFQIRYALERSQCDSQRREHEIVGKTDYDLSPAFLADQFRIDDEIVLAGKRIIDRIERVGEWHGPVRWNVTNKVPVFDRTGKIVGTAGITRPFSNASISTVATERAFASALEYIGANYQNLITNQQLAAVAKMSTRAFERRFLATFHVTPQKYIRRIRLSVATRALIYGNDALAEVALKCGFGDQSHFTREFRRHFGRTPRKYRERYRTDAAFRTKSGVREQ